MGRPRQEEDRSTIQAVAKRAGVSMMTVSNVINRTGRVGETTRDRVLSAVTELGYVPNQHARRLAGNAVACVGLVYPSVQSIFIDAMLAGIAVTAAEKGVQLLMRTPDAQTVDEAGETARELVRLGAQGLLLLPPYAELLGGRPDLYGIGVPAAAIATAVAIPNMTTVRVDNRSASRAVTERMIAAGRRRIAVLAGPQYHSDGVARLEGYRDALRAHGLEVYAALEVVGDFTFGSGLEEAGRLLDRDPRPDAIVAANDDMAAAALWIAHQRGLRLPDDLAVAGFDDTMIATRVWPPLTTVRQPIRDMAAVAMAHLTAAIEGTAEPVAPVDVVLPHELVERESA